jgi:hypothetical protein
MRNGPATLSWSATAFSPVFGESAARMDSRARAGFVARESLDRLHQKEIDSAKADLNHR